MAEPHVQHPHPDTDAPSARDRLDGFTWHPAIRDIPRTDSTAWGSPGEATARAMTETLDKTKTIDKTQTPDTHNSNEELIRTHHPSLSKRASVAAWHDHYADKDIWIVWAEEGSACATHAAGREIHFFPSALARQTWYAIIVINGGFDDPIRLPLNARRFLSDADLRRIHKAYPDSVGVRVLISGSVVVIHKSQSDIDKVTWRDGIGWTVGTLRVYYSIWGEAATQVTPNKAAVMIRRSILGSESKVSVGLKLRLADDLECMTVPTSSFVKVYSPKDTTHLRIANLLGGSIARFRPLAWLDTIARAFPGSGNTPLGQKVWLPGTRHWVGKVTTTFDPSPIRIRRPYPYGLQHDLSLVTGDLPDLCSPPGTPKVSGWGSYEEALNGGPCFLTKQNLASHPIRTTETHSAIVEGVQYMWAPKSSQVNVALLWRTTESLSNTVPVARRGKKAASPGFGDEHWRTTLGTQILCLGEPADESASALCFQNFEIPVMDGCQSRGGLMGGFLLPDCIREAEILSDAAEDEKTHTDTIRCESF